MQLDWFYKLWKCTPINHSHRLYYTVYNTHSFLQFFLDLLFSKAFGGLAEKLITVPGKLKKKHQERMREIIRRILMMDLDIIDSKCSPVEELWDAA